MLPFDKIEEKQDYVSVAGDSDAARKGNYFHIPRIGFNMTLCHEGYIDVAFTKQKATCPICLAEYAKWGDGNQEFSLARWNRAYGARAIVK